MREAPYGFERVYCDEAWPFVEAYYAELQEIALECRELFAKRREIARAKFHETYPDGKLPDEADDGKA